MAKDSDTLGKMTVTEFLKYRCPECAHFLILHPDLKHVWVVRMTSPFGEFKSEHIDQEKTLEKYG